MTRKTYEGRAIRVSFDPKICIHARRCVLGLPGVFDTDARPWVQPDGADPQAVARTCEECPSGALTYELVEGERSGATRTNTLRLWENGPLEVRGDVTVEGLGRVERAVLCRCGKTGNPPFCDNSHRQGFAATGLPPAKPDRDADLTDCTGAVEIAIRENGPYMVRGRVEVVGSDGHRIARIEKASLCRCGASGDKPFCDGSHRKIGFTKPVRDDGGDEG